MPSLDDLARRAADDDLLDVAVADVDAPFGRMLAAATPEGLVRMAFGAEDREEVLEDLAVLVSPRVLEAPSRLDAVRRQLDEYFEGRRYEFDLPIDWRLSHGFRRNVLRALYDDVAFGHTVSYRDLAERVGSPRAMRAVGTAMATNPVPIVVPCHRVLRTGGALGGYGGGLDVKRYLLELEGVTPPAR
jgi:methylated-DNA-[protein]-cysteine S-methyltransferase